MRKEKCGPQADEVVIRALCYLYREAIRENSMSLAEILEQAIEKARAVVGYQTLSDSCCGAMKEYTILSKFQKLSEEDQNKFIKKLNSEH